MGATGSRKRHKRKPQISKHTQGNPQVTKDGKSWRKGSQTAPKGTPIAPQSTQSMPKVGQRIRKIPNAAKGARYIFENFRSTAQPANMILVVHTCLIQGGQRANTASKNTLYNNDMIGGHTIRDDTRDSRNTLKLGS